jgi:hypothetical protein
VRTLYHRQQVFYIAAHVQLQIRGARGFQAVRLFQKRRRLIHSLSTLPLYQELLKSNQKPQTECFPGIFAVLPSHKTIPFLLQYTKVFSSDASFLLPGAIGPARLPPFLHSVPLSVTFCCFEQQQIRNIQSSTIIKICIFFPTFLVVDFFVNRNSFMCGFIKSSSSPFFPSLV